jgi:hypothetical protein
MEEQQSYDIQETRSIAERVLSETFGGPVRLEDGIALKERAHVARFAVREAPSSAPASVIIKQARIWEGQSYDPDSTDLRAPSAHLFNDWAALQFLSQVAGDARIAPQFYGGDRAAGLFVLEDLGMGISPDQVLLGSDPVAAEATLIELAGALGRMHAATIGRQAEFDRLRDALGPRPAEAQAYGWLVDGLQTTAAALDVPLRPGATDDLAVVIDVLADPGPFLAYTHGDPCPDNWLHTGGRLRLFDFEIGAFRHALTDGVYGRIHFPTCWCVNRIPAAISLRMQAVYRDELARACPAAADDDQYQRAIIEACAYWVLQLCARRWGIIDMLAEDREWGIATVRQRVLLRFGILSHMTEQAGYLAALGATIADLAGALRARWPPEADAMPYYPAFRGGDGEQNDTMTR